ncbi:PAS domain S-box protein [Pedobacter sp. MR22-3]|uniref:PAS domain-containing sensor histidine kinase n=1 Tax=Pedobacter sp. MR22-3 TaxID=2994552 RepID=UPI002247D60A|nr:PAS domain S-box protein [Pedobacter sp. MR22-3]MCX2582773.1 PAS domain-containing protein [Pedobacter sp. MR22-3]
MSNTAANQDRFGALVAATSDVVYRMSPDWEVMYELDGRGFLKSTSEPLKNWRNHNVHPADLQMVNEAISWSIATKSMFELEHRVLRADGSTGWTISRAVPILNDAGDILEWFGAAKDITLRKQTEHELQQAKELAEQQQRLYETVTSNTPDLIYVFGLDYRFTYANKALLEMWGKRWEDAVGKTLLENGYEPWHAEMHEREIDEIITTGKPIRGEVDFPHAALGNRTYDYILTPVFDSSGLVVAISGITRDVTQRKQQEQEKFRLSAELALLNEAAEATNEELNAANEELQTSQNRLSEANRNLELILNMLPASVVVIRGYDLVVELINESNLKYWNKSKEEVLGKRFLDILPDLADQPFAGQLRKVMDTGEVIDVKESPVLFTMPDGTIRETYVDYTYQPLADAFGNRNGVLVMSFEITERILSKRLLEKYTAELTQVNKSLSIANNKLAASEARFKFFIEEAPVAIGVLHARELIVETANQKILEVWGKSPEIIGLPLAQALPELSGQPFLGILDNVFMTGVPFYANEISAMLNHGGELKEIFFNVVYQPVVGQDGAVSDILIVATDVTEQVHARRSIEQSEQHFRKLADLVPAKISNALPNGMVTFSNQHWLDFTGMSFENLRDFGYYQIMHPDEIASFKKGLEVAAANGTPHVAEMRFKDRNGNYIWHLNISSPILDEEGKVMMWVGSTTDIQTIKEEEQRKSDFVSMLSHELKTPVTSIKGHVQLALRLLSRETLSPSLQKLSTSLSRIDVLLLQLTGLIRDMLDLSRIDAGRMDLKVDHFAIDTLVKEVVEDFRLSHQQYVFHLETAANIFVHADRDRISQVLINLIANAIKYSPKSNQVDIAVSTTENEVLIDIKDYGIGIEAKDQTKIFERFFRVEGQNEKYFSGFGIGLFLAHNIISRHGGEILLESERNQGSVFTVHLPI